MTPVTYSMMLRYGRQQQATALVALVDLSHERFLRQIGIRTRRYGPPQIVGTNLRGRPIQAVAGEIPLLEQFDDRFPSLLQLSASVEICDETLAFGRRFVSA